MINRYHIHIAALFIMAFLTLFATESRAAVLEQAANYDVIQHTTTERNEIELVVCDHNSTAIATSTSAPRTLTPEVRTIHSLTRNVERTSQHQRVSTAIDSTTTATRYGLYNHKMLFVSIARQHYVCRLRRLII
jgi:hypothetical protein